MCILCNCGDAGEEFLKHFEAASSHMLAAERAMLDCSRVANERFKPEMASETRTRYDEIHKKIVKMRKDWNRLEHEREVRREVVE